MRIFDNFEDFCVKLFLSKKKHKFARNLGAVFCRSKCDLNAAFECE